MLQTKIQERVGAMNEWKRKERPWHKGGAGIAIDVERSRARAGLLHRAVVAADDPIDVPAVCF